MDPDQWSKATPSLVSEFAIREGVSYWVPQPKSLTYAVGKPGRFPTEFPFYLPVEYLNIVSASHESNDEGGSPSPMERITADAGTCVTLDESNEYSDICTALTSLDPNSIINESIPSDHSEAAAEDEWKHEVTSSLFNCSSENSSRTVMKDISTCDEHFPSQAETTTTSGTTESAEDELDVMTVT
eukprot:Gregarina_sp_Poly_1__8262@NODE_481_length_8028_cov_336_122975_g389_i0_p6_GENE_NODE_481_length_8028_cov_336_122975_g389_i0NODE_481_length_8028_cov_336_122975_g389_i0_p6_ORF_typecomplete_len185_score25_72_NODE_481_length_8028_cov_336_122975_g389_i05881142